jgi:hypothetical protein
MDKSVIVHLWPSKGRQYRWPCMWNCGTSSLSKSSALLVLDPVSPHQLEGVGSPQSHLWPLHTAGLHVTMFWFAHDCILVLQCLAHRSHRN